MILKDGNSLSLLTNIIIIFHNVQRLWQSVKLAEKGYDKQKSYEPDFKTITEGLSATVIGREF